MLGASRHGAYLLTPAEIHALAWNISSAAVTLALMLTVAWRWHSWPVVAVAGWWAVEELLVIGCNAAYIVKPWIVPAGQDMCSSLLGLDLGKVSAVALALLVVMVVGKPIPKS